MAADPNLTLTLDEFVAQSQRRIEQFAMAHRLNAAEEPESTRVVGTLAEWLQEVCTYYEYAELQEAMSHDRRQGGTVERRRHSR